jgi:hypothetical protein
MQILFGDFNAKMGREDIIKLTIGNERLHETSNDNGVRVVYFATSKYLVVKGKMSPLRKIKLGLLLMAQHTNILITSW